MKVASGLIEVDIRILSELFYGPTHKWTMELWSHILGVARERGYLRGRVVRNKSRCSTKKKRSGVSSESDGRHRGMEKGTEGASLRHQMHTALASVGEGVADFTGSGSTYREKKIT